MMKKVFSVILTVIMTLSLFSCSNDAESENIPPDNNGIETKPGSFEGVSSDRFSDVELLTFEHEEGTVELENGYMAMFSSDSSLKITTFDSEDGESYNEGKAPFGIKIGDNGDAFVKAFSVDGGFAIFVDSSGAYHSFSNGETVDVPEGAKGYIYLGYGKEAGKWAFMDHEMLKSVIMGKALMMGTDEFPVILFSCILDENEKIVEMYEFYGEINTVMAYIAG